jgi:hypothetical protein
MTFALMSHETEVPFFAGALQKKGKGGCVSVTKSNEETRQEI